MNNSLDQMSGQAEALKGQLEDIDKLAESVGTRMVTAFASAATQGKNLSDVLKGLGLSLARMALSAALRPLGAMLGGLTGGLMKNAAGNAFSGGQVIPFADGGIVNADDYRPDGLERNYGMGADGLYRLSDTQAQEILQMRLQRLTGLEQDKIVAEYKEVMAEIDDLLDILASAERVSVIIGTELAALKQEFGQTKGGARRSHVEHNAQDLATEDLITPTDMVTLRQAGRAAIDPRGRSVVHALPALYTLDGLPAHLRRGGSDCLLCRIRQKTQARHASGDRRAGHDHRHAQHL